MKSAVELLLVLIYSDYYENSFVMPGEYSNQERSREDNVKLNFLGVIWESKMS